MTRVLIFVLAFLFSQIKAQEVSVCGYRNLFITRLKYICEYPFKLQDRNKEALVAIEYQTNDKGYVIKRRIVMCDNNKFRKTTLRAFDKMKSVQIDTKATKDTLYFQYKIQESKTPIHQLTDIEIIGYGSCNKPVLMK